MIPCPSRRAPWIWETWLGADGSEIESGLLSGGLDAQTPAALISNASKQKQSHVIAELGQLADTLKESGLGSPCVFVIGDVVRTGDPAALFGDGSYFRVAERESISSPAWR